MLRLVDTGKIFVGFAITGGAARLKIEGDAAEEVWPRLQNEVRKANPRYFGFDGARNRLLHFFPNGFHSDGYAGEERTYKVAAKIKLDQQALVAEAAEGSGLARQSWPPSEQRTYCRHSRRLGCRLRCAGSSATHSLELRRGSRSTRVRMPFTTLEQALKRHDVAKWTAVTYLPFLWRPEAHMFLKPEVTKICGPRRAPLRL